MQDCPRASQEALRPVALHSTSGRTQPACTHPRSAPQLSPYLQGGQRASPRDLKVPGLKQNKSSLIFGNMPIRRCCRMI